MYMREDLPRTDVCGTVARPFDVRIQDTAAQFRLGERTYRVLRVQVEETGDSVFVVQRD